ncbi:MAG: cupin domain-containing protein [Anaerolineae bacterium]
MAKNEEKSRGASFLQMLAAGTDRFGQVRDLGISTLNFKVTHAESSELFIAENLLRAKGGPVRHIHHTQDEWFFVRKGEFLIEVGAERHVLKPGDSIWGPRGVPHAWAFTGEGDGCILFVFNPPAKIEAFFETLARLKSYAPSAPEFWAEYEMELVGPPLQV